MPGTRDYLLSDTREDSDGESDSEPRQASPWFFVAHLASLESLSQQAWVEAVIFDEDLKNSSVGPADGSQHSGKTAPKTQLLVDALKEPPSSRAGEEEEVLDGRPPQWVQGAKAALEMLKVEVLRPAEAALRARGCALSYHSEEDPEVHFGIDFACEVQRELARRMMNFEMRLAECLVRFEVAKQLSEKSNYRREMLVFQLSEFKAGCEATHEENNKLRKQIAADEIAQREAQRELRLEREVEELERALAAKRAELQGVRQQRQLRQLRQRNGDNADNADNADSGDNGDNGEATGPSAAAIIAALAPKDERVAELGISRLVVGC